MRSALSGKVPNEENAAAQFKLRYKEWNVSIQQPNPAVQASRSALCALVAISSNPTRHQDFLCRLGRSNSMYILKLIGLTIVNLVRGVWSVPQGFLRAAQERRQQTTRERSEAERLDRIRQPWKYLGR